jgi:hypothetical protein
MKASTTTHFAVWEHQCGAHAGYVWSGTDAEPYLTRYAVGYCGFSTLREALASVKKHRETPCDGHCETYLRRKGVRHGITFTDQ